MGRPGGWAGQEGGKARGVGRPGEWAGQVAGQVTWMVAEQ